MIKDYFDPKQDLSFKSADEIRAVQARLLHEHIAYCRIHSPFYHHWHEDAVSLDTLHTMERTGKEDLSERNDDFLAVPEREVADICLTSGTTGRPCRIAYTVKDLDRLGYNDALGFGAAGIRPGDKVLLTCTIDRCFIAGLAYYMGAVKLGASAVRNGLNTVESHAELIRSMRIDAIVGVPSFLVRLATYLREQGIDDSSIRTLVCIGEPVRNRNMQTTPLGARLEAFYPNKIHSTYASSEIATSFTECSCCHGGHLPPDLALVEVVDEDGRVLPPGEVGEVTVTPLQVTGMPLLRFRTGDMGFILPGRCSCGRNSVRLGPILGRRAQMLKIRGTTLFPSSFTTVLDAMEEVIDYYLEITGSALSDEVTVFVSVRPGTVSEEDISERLYNRTRIHVAVHTRTAEAVRSRVFGFSRKPVRFFDRRTLGDET